MGGDKQAVWLDLGHVELDIEAFLGAAAEGLRAAAQRGRGPGARARSRPPRRATAASSSRRTRTRTGRSALREEAQAAYISVTRLLADEAAATGDADGATRYYLRILERDAYDEAAHLGLVGALLAAGRHGEARRRYGIYSDKMDEMGVEAAPFPSPRAAAAAARTATATR